MAMNEMEKTVRTQALALLSAIKRDRRLMWMLTEYNQKQLQRLQERLMSRRLTVGFVGELKRGRSTVINALLGKDILPTDIVANTAVVFRVTEGPQLQVQLHLRDGSATDVAVEALAERTTMYNPERDTWAKRVDRAVVYDSYGLCRGGMDLLETPGFGMDEERDLCASRVISEMDMAVMVLVPDRPMTRAEAELVCTRLMSTHIRHLLFAVNKMYLVRPKDRQGVKEWMPRRCREVVLKYAREYYGPDSPEYAFIKARMETSPFLFLSALDALDGYLGEMDTPEENRALIEKSGILELEAALEAILVQWQNGPEICQIAQELCDLCQKVLPMKLLPWGHIRMRLRELQATLKALQETS